ncbi:MAG: prepilin-type N-terminal cleavage/methylation domain-containing protein [Vicinamibacterales bacterium]
MTVRRARSALARGFTLIELLVVMSLVVVLSAIAMVGYQNSVTRAREATLKADLYHMRDAIDQYYADKQKWPATLQDLVTDGYVRRIPEDPMTSSADTWQEIPAEADPANPSAETGIYDVKSGSDKISLDGTPYAEW